MIDCPNFNNQKTYKEYKPQRTLPSAHFWTNRHYPRHDCHHNYPVAGRRKMPTKPSKKQEAACNKRITKPSFFPSIYDSGKPFRINYGGCNRAIRESFNSVKGFVRPETKDAIKIIQFFLPLSGFYQLANFAFDQVALQGADVTDVELAIEMVGFMLEGAGQEFFAGFFEDVSFGILGADGDGLGARDVFAEVGDAEAAFALGMFAGGVNDFRVDEDQLGIGIFFEGDVDDGDAPGDTDLRSGQADAVRGVHGLEHVVEEGLQVRVEDGDFFRRLLQHRVAELNDGIDHL